VRIRLPDDVKSKSLLRPGMSVVVNVDTRSKQTVADGGGLSLAAQAVPLDTAR